MALRFLRGYNFGNKQINSFVRSSVSCICVYFCCSIILLDGAKAECGDDPMAKVLMVAKKSGQSLENILMLLHGTPFYDTLERNFRSYAECVGLVDTGYFKKRGYIPPRQSTEKDDDYMLKRPRQDGHTSQLTSENKNSLNKAVGLNERLDGLIRTSQRLLKLLMASDRQRRLSKTTIDEELRP